MKFGGTDRRRLAIVGALIGAFVAVAVAFGVVQASATPGAGIVGGPIVARGPRCTGRRHRRAPDRRRHEDGADTCR